MPIMVIAPLVLVVLVGLMVVSTWLIIRRRRARLPDGAVCGGCGYAVRELTTFTCPECGDDLREVGILTANLRRGASPIALALIWAVLMPFAALIIANTVGRFVTPRETVISETRSFAPDSEAYRRLDLNYDARYTIWPWQKGLAQEDVSAGTVRLTITTNTDERLTITIDHRRNRFQVADAHGSAVEGRGEPAQQTVIDAMNRSGIEVMPAVEAEVREMLAFAEELRYGSPNLNPPLWPAGSGRTGWSGTGTSRPGLTALPGAGGTARYDTPDWFGVPALLFWLVVWVGGHVVIIRSGGRTKEPKH